MTYALLALVPTVIAAKLVERRTPRLYQAVLLVAIVAPLAATVYAMWRLWQDWIGWRELTLFLVLYVLTGLGTTVGYHRLVAHESFRTGPLVKGVLLALGAMNLQGQVINWALTTGGTMRTPTGRATRTARGTVCSTHTSAGSSRPRPPSARATASGCWRTPSSCSSTGRHLCGQSPGSRSRTPSRAGRDCSGAGSSESLSRTTSPSPSTRSATCTARERSARRTTVGTTSSLACSASARAGTTTTTAFPRAACHGFGRRQPDLSGVVIRALERVGLAWDVKRPPATVAE